MIMTCAECHTRYMVPDGVLTPEGRRVRCSSCGHEWFHRGKGGAVSSPPEEFETEPDDSPSEPSGDDEVEIEAIPESVKPIQEAQPAPIVLTEEDGKTPVPLTARLAGYAAAAAVFLLLSGGVFMARHILVRAWPPSLVLFDMAGVKTQVEGETLVFEGLKAVAKGEYGKPVTLTVEARIINLGREEAKIPPIQTSLIKPDGTVADSWLTELEQNIVVKQGEAAFQTSYPDIPADIKEVNVRFIPGARLQKADKKAASAAETDSHDDRDSHDNLQKGSEELAPPAPHH